MRGIHRIPLDFPFLYPIRKLVYRLDNALFNAKGSCGIGYEPTQYLLVLPYLAGIFAAVYCIFCSLTGPRGAEMAAQRQVVMLSPLLVLANLLLMSKHIICMPTWPKRILYPVFVIVFTGLCAYATMYLSYLLAMLFCVVVVLMAFLGGKGGGSSHGGLFSSGGNNYREEVVVDDGSFFGKTLHRDNGCGDWSDGSGHSYEETSEGFVQKY